jgi:hypothetical protein
MYYTNNGTDLYQGDMRVGDRKATTAEVTAYEALKAENEKIKIVTMRQARLALLQLGLLTKVDTAVLDSTDNALKIEWKYATDVRRDWPSLISVATALGMTSQELDDLFTLAKGL